MRLMSALRADVKFQFKQGFYLVYIVLTLLYMIILGQIPEKFGKMAVPFVVFSDPSVVGFFFIGGIVMLEKVQGVLQYLAVTPLRTREYLLAKVISLSMLAVTAGFAITAVTYPGDVNWLLLAGGILLTSVFFTLFGFVAAIGCNTVNQYFIKMVPYTLFMVLPCFSLIGFPYAWLMNIFPGVAGLKLILGAFQGIEVPEAILYMACLIVFNAALLFLVERIFDRNVSFGGDGE